TGLWTAYELKRAEPGLEIVVLEREFAGFGASGRNGGWLSSAFAASRGEVAATPWRDALLALQRALGPTVDAALGVCEREGIAADIVKPGVLHVARNPAQHARLAAHVAAEREWDHGPDDLVELDAAGVAARLRVDGALSGAWSPHCARVQPAKLVRG